MTGHPVPSEAEARAIAVAVMDSHLAAAYAAALRYHFGPGNLGLGPGHLDLGLGSLHRAPELVDLWLDTRAAFTRWAAGQ